MILRIFPVTQLSIFHTYSKLLIPQKASEYNISDNENQSLILEYISKYNINKNILLVDNGVVKNLTSKNITDEEINISHLDNGYYVKYSSPLDKPSVFILDIVNFENKVIDVYFVSKENLDVIKQYI